MSLYIISVIVVSVVLSYVITCAGMVIYLMSK